MSDWLININRYKSLLIVINRYQAIEMPNSLRSSCYASTEKTDAKVNQPTAGIKLGNVHAL